jgi:hypothetical protein
MTSSVELISFVFKFVMTAGKQPQNGLRRFILLWSSFCGIVLFFGPKENCFSLKLHFILAV